MYCVCDAPDVNRSRVTTRGITKITASDGSILLVRVLQVAALNQSQTKKSLTEHSCSIHVGITCMV